MWLYSVIIFGVVFPASNAQQFFVQFRTPKQDSGLLSGEAIETANPVSFFYVDVVGVKIFPKKDTIEDLLEKHPCLMMEPAYALVRDQMTFYGTCDSRQMVRLALKRTGEHWTPSVKLAANDGCKDALVREFYLAWQG